MVKALKDLFVALLNATLLLIVACLFLGLLILNRANDLSENFAEQLQVITPVKDGVQNAAAEITALRSDLKDLSSQPGTLSPEALEALQAKVSGVEDRLETMQTALTELKGVPERLIDQALAKAGQQISDTAIRVRGCVPTETPEL